MRYIVITRDPEILEAANEGFHPSDVVDFFENWEAALDCAGDCDLIFVDMLATLTEPHKIEGYEKFALAKMDHSEASIVPLVLIGPDASYKLDFMVGWPNFLLGHLQRPVSYKQLRRASTWV